MIDVQRIHEQRTGGRAPMRNGYRQQGVCQLVWCNRPDAVAVIFV
jgi:hypothetical protein